MCTHIHDIDSNFEISLLALSDCKVLRLSICFHLSSGWKLILYQEGSKHIFLVSVNFFRYFICYSIDLHRVLLIAHELYNAFNMQNV